jgi:hypothetical protein
MCSNREMRMSFRPAALAFLCFLLIASAARAQLPAPQKLSPEDDRDFNQELDQLRGLLSRANSVGRQRTVLHRKPANRKRGQR